MSKINQLPQKYTPVEYELEIFDFWNRNDVYHKVVEEQRNRPKFYFLDGPPYVTNPIHVGTAWNKIIKDAFLRFYRMRGYMVWDRPGYDMHGLPIEVQVEKNLGLKTKRDILKLGVEKFVNECREWALKNLKIQERQFKELGVWMSWEQPYRTIENEYIEAAWLFIKKSAEKGLLEHGEKVVYWCPRCQTVLSGYEVTEEYREVEDPSIYVKFPANEINAKFLVWTTTPWTLPGNVAIMVNPDETYVKARERKTGEILILAKKRIETVEKETGISLEIIEEFPGSKLEGLTYEHPLKDLLPLQSNIIHKIVLSKEYVSMEEGTGLVHTAPGHGREDFEIGMKYGLPALSPIDDSGEFTPDAGPYAGIYVKEANKLIIEDLKRREALLYDGKIIHRYPHCWRCKTPLIQRLSKQWFITVSKIKDELVKLSDQCTWIPQWALETRFKPWLRNAHDWAISRQRYWGIPLPIWKCESCGHTLVIGSLDELKNLAISIPDGPVDLHRPWVDKVIVKCPKCGGSAKRVSDVIDVWIDSGVAPWASLKYPSKKDDWEKLKPVDLVIEGQDQIRGWFYSLFTAGYITWDMPIYRKVIMHGFGLDETGRAMHKSLGNVINPDDVIPKYGRDALRLFELSNVIWEDLRFSMNGVKEAFRALSIIWNTFYFASLYMSLDKFDPQTNNIEQLKEHLHNEDKWLLSRFQKVIKYMTESMEDGRIHDAVRTIINFLIEDVSRWYVKLIRRRVWIEPNDPDKLAAYATLYTVLEGSLRLLAPYTPFIAEKIYQSMFRNSRSPISIHMLNWPTYREDLIDERLEKLMELAKQIVTAASMARQTKGLKLRKPVQRIIIVSKQNDILDMLKVYESMLKTQMNTKSILLAQSEEIEKELKTVEVKLNLTKAGPILRDNVSIVMDTLKNIDGREALNTVTKNGFIEVNTPKGVIKLEKEMLLFEEKVSGDFAVGQFNGGYVYVDLKIPKELEAEALAREIVRRVQTMRKQLNLPVDAFIKVHIAVPSQDEAELIRKARKYIKNETRARMLRISLRKPSKKMNLIQEWEIENDIYTIGISFIPTTIN